MTDHVKETEVLKKWPSLPISLAELREARKAGKIHYTPGRRTHWYTRADLDDYVESKGKGKPCQTEKSANQPRKGDGPTTDTGSTTTLKTAPSGMDIGTSSNVVRLRESSDGSHAGEALRQRMLSELKSN